MHFAGLPVCWTGSLAINCRQQGKSRFQTFRAWKREYGVTGTDALIVG